MDGKHEIFVHCAGSIQSTNRSRTNIQPLSLFPPFLSLTNYFLPGLTFSHLLLLSFLFSSLLFSVGWPTISTNFLRLGKRKREGSSSVEEKREVTTNIQRMEVAIIQQGRRVHHRWLQIDDDYIGWMERMSGLSGSSK